MTPQEKLISKFLLAILAVGLLVGLSRRTWLSDDLEITEAVAEAKAAALIAEERRASLLSGQDFTSNIFIEKVNLNTASKSELVTLPGIGPTLAERIIAYREQVTPFKTIDELRKVKGIGDRSIEKLRRYLEL